MVRVRAVHRRATGLCRKCRRPCAHPRSLPPSSSRAAADIYISVLGNSHKVVAPNKYCAILSTTVETDKPLDELKAALDMLPQERITQFKNQTDTVVPVEDGTRSKIFISSSYDASSHFEITTDEVLDMYRRIMGEELDLTQKAEVEMGGGGQ